MLAVLQFDAASVEVLDRLFSAGRLPVLAGLRERGRWHELETPAGHFAAGSFHTLYSGVPVPEHGLYYPFQWSGPDQRVRYMTAFPAPPSVWETLAEQGRRSLVIDPYEGRPAKSSAGVSLSGWQFKSRVVLPRWSSPPGAGRRFARAHGRPPTVEEIFGRPSVAGLLKLRSRLLEAPARAADVATRLLAAERFELAWITFPAAHIAGHQFWDLSQIDPEGLDQGSRRLLASTLDDVYAAVDRELGRIVDALPRGSDVLVTSGLGMGPNTSRSDLLPEMLDRVMRGRSDADAGGGGSGAVWRLRAALPTDVRDRAARALPDRVALGLASRVETPGHDWADTRAFAVPADHNGHVRFNLRGRERDGIVDPAEAADLEDEIRRGLETFRDHDGERAVKSVDRVADLLGEGSRAHQLPDLLVRWSERPATRLTGVTSPEFGEVLRHGGATGRSGNHTAGDAWALLVPGTSHEADPGRPRRLEDIPATALALGGAHPGYEDRGWGRPLLVR